jgi:hypothetical protein
LGLKGLVVVVILCVPTPFFAMVLGVSFFRCNSEFSDGSRTAVCSLITFWEIKNWMTLK